MDVEEQAAKLSTQVCDSSWERRCCPRARRPTSTRSQTVHNLPDNEQFQVWKNLNRSAISSLLDWCFMQSVARRPRNLYILSQLLILHLQKTTIALLRLQHSS